MHLGIALPFGDIGGDGPIVREFAELAEAEGYDGLTLAEFFKDSGLIFFGDADTRVGDDQLQMIGLVLRCGVAGDWRGVLWVGCVLTDAPARGYSDSAPFGGEFDSVGEEVD